MNEIIKVIMERDDMSEEEARELVNNIRAEAEPFIIEGDFQAVEDLLLDDLGLELDYMPEFLYG